MIIYRHLSVTHFALVRSVSEVFLESLFGLLGKVSFSDAVAVQVYVASLREVIRGDVFVLYLSEVRLDALGVVAECSQKVVSARVHN